ncbi:homoserine dehydrogenase [Tersicoccus sp. MR15.9]|uniref:homoserine dehydrogenase n=1 Tax=Tersicoccus mangrovi TaxID=3121635 RepID=UPI002FE654AD
METLKVALLGAGNVGAQVARILLEDADALAGRVGARLALTGIAVRDVDAPRAVDLPRELLSTDAEAVMAGADLVVELMGGIEPARTLILAALASGATVVTGNKALLAEHGPELYAAAEDAGVQLAYEAAVAGAIPIIRPVRDNLAGDNITKVLGIVNGTTNYILDAMDATGASFADALADAQRLGYAEADPTADVEGLDAAAKATILASLAFHTSFDRAHVWCEGITAITAEDVAAARDAGYVIKLLAICETVPANPADQGASDGDRGVAVRVHPTLLPREHALASVRGAYNAVYIEAEYAGSLMFYGAGAGGVPTASAVLGDIVSSARRRVLGGPGVTESVGAHVTPVGLEAVVTSYAIGLRVADASGVLAAIAAVFADHGVSIETMRQSTHTDGAGDETAGAQSEGDGERAGGDAELRIVTHRALDTALRRTVEAVGQLDVVHEVTSILRVEGA